MFIALVSGPEVSKTTAGIAAELNLYSKLEAGSATTRPERGAVPVFDQTLRALFREFSICSCSLEAKA